MPVGRLAARLDREGISLEPANLVYPGVEISMSTALRSMRGVEMVATFHCVPDVGSRRMRVIWKPPLLGRSLCVFLCREGDCPGLLNGDPGRS